MEEKKENIKMSVMECCPELEHQSSCDALKFRYRLPFFPLPDGMKQRIPVDVILYFELERCSGPLVISDPIYSTTLLPGEQVRLFTSDRHTQWSYDSESKLSYRHQTTSEESYYAAGMAEAMSDLTVNEKGSSRSSYEDSWAEGGGGASFSFFGLIKVGGGGGGGSYDSESTNSFSHSLSRHAESASRYVAASVRAKSATSIGEVEQRKHAEGESEAHQRVPVDTTGRIMIKPEIISAASKERLEKEKMARTSAAERQQTAASAVGFQQAGLYTAASYKSAQMVFERSDPTYDIHARKAAIEAVDRELINAGILEQKTREPSDAFVKELYWEREEILLTPGIIVKGCLDECATCEPALLKDIELDLERKKIENEMLKRQTELLEKSQEYRCYPGESVSDDEPHD